MARCHDCVLGSRAVVSTEAAVVVADDIGPSVAAEISGSGIVGSDNVFEALALAGERLECPRGFAVLENLATRADAAFFCGDRDTLPCSAGVPTDAADTEGRWSAEGECERPGGWGGVAESKEAGDVANGGDNGTGNCSAGLVDGSCAG